MIPLAKQKTEFLEYLEVEKNRSRLTIRNYDHYLGRFLDFATKHGVSSADKITLDLVRKFRLALNRSRDERGRELKLITQNYHTIALRSFLKYLARRDINTLAAEKLDLPKTTRRQVEFLDRTDLGRLLASPAASGEKNELITLRDQAILEMLFSTGLRVAELASLSRKQINPKKDEFTVKGKGEKLRIVFLSPRAKAALSRYLNARPDNSPALFVRHNQNLRLEDSQPISSRTIQRIVKKYALLCGISTNITPHTLRHTMATDLLSSGADLRSVQEILGHSSITTTQIYMHVTNKRLKEIHQKYHGTFRTNN